LSLHQCSTITKLSACRLGDRGNQVDQVAGRKGEGRKRSYLVMHANWRQRKKT